MEADIRHMKWWGWGHEDVTFDDSTKPELWPYLKRELGVDEIRWEKPVAFEDVTLPEQKTTRHSSPPSEPSSAMARSLTTKSRAWFMLPAKVFATSG